MLYFIKKSKNIYIDLKTKTPIDIQVDECCDGL